MIFTAAFQNEQQFGIHILYIPSTFYAVLRYVTGFDGHLLQAQICCCLAYHITGVAFMFQSLSSM
jgi:hypothetical protein